MHQLYEMFSNCEAALVLMSQHNLAFNRTRGLSVALHLSFLLKLSLRNPLAKSAARLAGQLQISERSSEDHKEIAGPSSPQYIYHSVFSFWNIGLQNACRRYICDLMKTGSVKCVQNTSGFNNSEQTLSIWASTGGGGD